MEVIIVVAILAVVAGLVVTLTGGANRRADEQMVAAECGELREAAQRFAIDMGEPPRLLAELIQSPDPSTTAGGWWWRTDSTPPSRLYTFDPATRRGWNGPYVQGSLAEAATTETAEIRRLTATTVQRTESNLSGSPKRGLGVIQSRYTSYPQKLDGARVVSHYQLDASDANELAIRFVRDPLAADAAAGEVVRLGLGVAP